MRNGKCSTLKISESRKKSPGQLRRAIMSETDGIEPEEIKNLDRNTRNEIIRMLVNEKGFSKSEITKATGLSRETIARICREVRRKLPRPQFDTHLL